MDLLFRAGNTPVLVDLLLHMHDHSQLSLLSLPYHQLQRLTISNCTSTVHDLLSTLRRASPRLQFFSITYWRNPRPPPGTASPHGNNITFPFLLDLNIPFAFRLSHKLFNIGIIQRFHTPRLRRLRLGEMNTLGLSSLAPFFHAISSTLTEIILKGDLGAPNYCNTFLATLRPMKGIEILSVTMSLPPSQYSPGNLNFLIDALRFPESVVGESGSANEEEVLGLFNQLMFPKLNDLTLKNWELSVRRLEVMVQSRTQSWLDGNRYPSLGRLRVIHLDGIRAEESERDLGWLDGMVKEGILVRDGSEL